MARHILLDQVGVPPDHIHPIPTHAGDPDGAGQLYEAELKRFRTKPLRGSRAWRVFRANTWRLMTQEMLSPDRCHFMRGPYLQ